MPRITVTISDELDEFLESESDDSDKFSSKSDVMRHYVERGREADDLEARLERREDRIAELEGQLRRRSTVEEKVDTLAKRVKENDAPAPPAPIRWIQWWRSRGSS